MQSEFSVIRVLYWVKFPKFIPKTTPQGVRKGRQRKNEHDCDISGLDGAYRLVGEFHNYHKCNQKASFSSPT